MARTLFARWVVLQAATVLFFALIAFLYGERVRGASLVAIVVILAVFLGATALGGRASWMADERPADALHLSAWLGFAAWVCQLLGIVGTIFGFWLIFSGGAGGASTLVAQIKEGGGLALSSTFVGVVCSLVLAVEERMIEHETQHR